MIKKCFMAGAAALGLALAAGSAQAAPVPVQFTANPGNVDPTIVLGPNSYQADQFAGFYDAQIDQDAFGNFTETGLIQIGQALLDGNQILPLNSGLNVDYGIYALFSASGQASLNLAGDIEVDFNDFRVEVWLDTGLDTTTSFVASNGNAIDEDGFAGQNAASQFAQSANEAHTLGMTADDVLILSVGAGDLISGFAAVSQLGGGTFEVSSAFNTDFGAPGDADDFFQFATNFINLSLFASGQTGVEIGLFPFGPVQDALFTQASANISFIPEPTTVGLLGLGLLGFGALGRRRRRAA